MQWLVFIQINSLTFAASIKKRSMYMLSVPLPWR